MTPVAIYLAAMAATAAQDKPVIAKQLPPPVIAAPAAPPTLEQLRRMRVEQISPPEPINPAFWITEADYPDAAKQAGAEGVVGFSLDVGANGRVLGCTITLSSRNAVLDEAACRLLARRARFKPARDANGAPLPGTYTSRIHWDLRGQWRPVPPEGEQVITLTVAPDGTISDCSFTAKGGPASSPSDPCKMIRFAPQAGEDAKSRRVRLTTRVEYLDPQ